MRRRFHPQRRHWGLSLSPNWGLFLSLGGDFSVTLDNVAVEQRVVGQVHALLAALAQELLDGIAAIGEGGRYTFSSLRFKPLSPRRGEAGREVARGRE